MVSKLILLVEMNHATAQLEEKLSTTTIESTHLFGKLYILAGRRSFVAPAILVTY
jgi:hypothetical protein